MGSLYFTRPTLVTYTAARAEYEASAGALFDLLGKGVLKLSINQRYPLADAARAHADLEAGRTIGSSVIVAMKGPSEVTTTVGVVGLGIMGSAMARNMLKAGFRVIGFDIVPASRAAFAKEGGIVARSPADVARRAPVVITSLPTTAAVEAVAAEIAAAKPKGLVVVETSTMPLETKERAQAVLAKAGVTLMDCPLSGTGAQARVKDLLVYASGPEGRASTSARRSSRAFPRATTTSAPSATARR